MSYFVSLTNAPKHHMHCICQHKLAKLPACVPHWLLVFGNYLSTNIIALRIEGLRAKRAYIEFWPIFSFSRIELMFGRLTCFDMKSIVPLLFRSICASFSRNNVWKKTQFSSGDLLFNEKQKKPFVSLSFISHIITVISYCCFVSASDWDVKWAWCEFVLLWHRFETRSANFFFFFFICFSTYFKNQNIYLKKTCSQSC